MANDTIRRLAEWSHQRYLSKRAQLPRRLLPWMHPDHGETCVIVVEDGRFARFLAQQQAGGRWRAPVSPWWALPAEQAVVLEFRYSHRGRDVVYIKFPVADVPACLPLLRELCHRPIIGITPQALAVAEHCVTVRHNNIMLHKLLAEWAEEAPMGEKAA